MWVRRGFFGWLIPAAFVLPLWLFIGWAVTGAGGWAFVWVLFIAIPGVFIWQLVLTLLVRARGTVRAQRAVSWWDVLGFTVWHALVISLGFFNPTWWTPALIVAILVGLGVFWSALVQLWREARPASILLRTTEGIGYIPPVASSGPAEERPEVIVISEKHTPTAS